jgi:DNA-binding winged helix-turn-helix (wHTH) protein
MTKAESRKHQGSYRFADFTLDLQRATVLKGDLEVKLRPKVYEALGYLIENRGRLVRKEELIQALWPDAFVTDDSLVQCMVELRRALDDRSQEILKTVPRRGYNLRGAGDPRQRPLSCCTRSESRAETARHGRLSPAVRRDTAVVVAARC